MALVFFKAFMLSMVQDEHFQVGRCSLCLVCFLIASSATEAFNLIWNPEDYFWVYKCLELLSQVSLFLLYLDTRPANKTLSKLLAQLVRASPLGICHAEHYRFDPCPFHCCSAVGLTMCLPTYYVKPCTMCCSFILC